MPAPSAYNVNWDRLVTHSTMAIQPQRWEALVKRLRLLSRTGVANFVTAMLAASPVPNATLAGLDEAELRATYEGPLSAAYLALASDTRTTVDRYARVLLGDNAANDPLGLTFWSGISGSDAAVGVLFAKWCDANFATAVLP